MALIWAAHGAILRGGAARHPERKAPPRGSDSPAHLCLRYSVTTSTIFHWRFSGCRGCGWHRCLRRYAPVPPAQTAAGRSIGPSRGRWRSGLLIGRVWEITSGHQKSRLHFCKRLLSNMNRLLIALFQHFLLSAFQCGNVVLFTSG